MSTRVQTVASVISHYFPEKAAENWDNPGLQVGHRNAEVKRILVALELTPAVLEEAIGKHVDLIVTHHPFIFKAMKQINDDSAEGRMILSLVENHIALWAAHTNLDAAPQAIADKLADDLELEDRRPVLPEQPYAAYKIVVFVPKSEVENVAHAMHDMGAGCIGNYFDVSFQTDGNGFFSCGAESNPTLGFPGSAECVREVRLEMVVSERDLKDVIENMKKAHPYEEPAFDVFKLENPILGISDEFGFGTIGKLRTPMKLAQLIEKVKSCWDIPALRVAGDPEKQIATVGIMNGAGAKYATSRVDVYISGDCGHHDFDRAIRENFALIDAGHYDTEKFIPEIIVNTLKRHLGEDVEIEIAQSMKNPMCVY